jgi:hypothetical protein
VIEDLKRREARLRQLYEREVAMDRQRAEDIKREGEAERKGYQELKQRLRDRNAKLEQEVIDLKDAVDGRERELKRAKREADKWQREAAMLREELSIITPVGEGASKNKGARFQSPHHGESTEERAARTQPLRGRGLSHSQLNKVAGAAVVPQLKLAHAALESAASEIRVGRAKSKERRQLATQLSSAEKSRQKYSASKRATETKQPKRKGGKSPERGGVRKSSKSRNSRVVSAKESGSASVQGSAPVNDENKQTHNMIVNSAQKPFQKKEAPSFH